MTYELRAYRDDHIGHIHAEDVQEDTLEQACRLADRFGLGYFTFESISGEAFNFSDGFVAVHPK